MKRLLFIYIVLLLLPTSGYSWGRVGHRTVAEIAERHLTPEAKQRIMHYTGGQSLASLSTWMDEVSGKQPYKQRLRGWHASIADHRCKSSVEVRMEHRNGRDGVTAMEEFKARLVQPERLNDSVVLAAIKCIVHIVGDFHCPQHVRYTDCKNGGGYEITFYDHATEYHKVWDSGVISRGRKGYDHKKYADLLDTYTDKQIAKVTKGWAKEWFEDAARTVRPTINTVNPGDTIGQEWVESVLPMGEELLRKAGYRLAKALNTIFGDK